MQHGDAGGGPATIVRAAPIALLDDRAVMGQPAVVAGPGSDLSEVPVSGREPAALEPVDAPACPPGPAPSSSVLVF